MTDESTVAAWQREPVVLRLANALLDRLERGPEERVRPVRLRLQSTVLPELFRVSARETDYQWSLIEQMEKAGWIRLVLESKLASESPYYRDPAAVLVDEAALRHITNRPAKRGATWQERFLAALSNHLPSGHRALQEAGRGSLGLDAYDPQLVAERLLMLHALIDEPLLIREVSSRLFFGQSKVLDGREALVAAVLDRDDCPFPECPLQMLVHMPKGGFHGILFIENPTVFEAFAGRRSPASEGLALIYAAGYRGSAKRMRKPRNTSLYFSGAPLPSTDLVERFSRWLTRESSELPTAFYGDLDYAGLDILGRLRESFPAAHAWEPGYQLLLESLQAGGGHPPEAARKAGQRDPGSTGCSYADTALLPAIRQYGRFVDQEGF